MTDKHKPMLAPDYDDEALRWLFTYHPPPGPEAVETYKEIRQAGLDMARVVAARVPPCADRSAAIRAIREAVMWANAGIATAPPPS